MKLSFKIISIIFFVLFLSCDKDGSIIVNPPVEEVPFVNDLQGDGCSDDYSCYSIDDVYLVDKNIRLLTEEYIDNNYGNIK